MQKRHFPYPSVSFAQQVAEVAESSLVALISGEITADVLGAVLGAAKGAGKAVDAWISVGGSGKDDSDPLQISGEIYLNGVSILSTLPVITHVSGEASTHKTTKESGDTGITQAVIDTDANDYSPGDVFSYDLTIERSSPDTEASNAVVVVELEPTR